LNREIVRPGEPAAPVQIPVQYASATPSRWGVVEVMVSWTPPGSFTKAAGFNSRPVEADELIARIRDVLQKPGAQ